MRSYKFLAGALCLFVAAIFLLSLAVPSRRQIGPKGYASGWDIGDQASRDRDDYLILDIPHDWRGSGEGQTRLLHDDWLSVYKKPYTPRDQGNAPSCVGQAVSSACDFLAAVEIASGEPERAPPARASAATIYGYSRQEIGELGDFPGGGSHNLWAVQAIQRYGVIAELRYGLLGIDLRESDPARCIAYGFNGVPDSLDSIARLHPVRDYISIDSYEELRDALYHNCPVVVGATQGFGDGRCTRDSEGFLNPPRRRWRPSVWNHSQAVIGVCDTGRKGVLIINSWGGEGPDGWVSGPKRFGSEPEGSYWVDAEIIDQMVSEGDSFAIRGFKGYSRYILWLPRRR